jgi:putative ABC transport system permease protein
MRFVAVDPDFFATYGIKLLTGRTFSRNVGADLSDIDLVGPQSLVAASVSIIDTRTARAFGWTPEEAVGKTFWNVPLDAPESGPPAGAPLRRIVGVVDDVYLQPLRETSQPLMFILPRGLSDQASLKIAGRDLESTLARIDAVWSRIVPEQPISRRFLDADFDAVYQSERRQGQMLTYCSSLSILIACLGLFGLASLTTEQRTKEIGIRKVLGSTTGDIVRLFAGEIGRLVLVANVIAWPVAYLLMRRWLDDFAYRIDLGLLIFVGSGLLVLAVAWLTVGVVAARAARAKPIHSLRYE